MKDCLLIFMADHVKHKSEHDTLLLDSLQWLSMSNSYKHLLEYSSKKSHNVHIYTVEYQSAIRKEAHLLQHHRWAMSRAKRNKS